LKSRSIIFLGLMLLLTTAHPLHSAALPSSTSVFLEELTWTELRVAIRSGKTTVIIPVGGTEQSGPAIALGKHNVRVKVLSGKIAQELGNAVVAPVIAYVPEGSITPPTSHMRYPGTISVPDEVFAKTLEYAARSMKQAGFQNIIFLGDHGGYQSREAAVAARLAREWNGSSVRVIALQEYYHASTDGFDAILKSRGYRETGGHAGLTDTSLQMAVAPGTVRGDLASTVGSNRDGVEGDPRRASADLGQLGVTEIVNTSVAAIRKYTSK
jgi:creatinine amidohydrolase